MRPPVLAFCLFTILLFTGLLLTGCGSLHSPITDPSGDLRENLSALDGRYESLGRPGPAEGVFALSCTPPVPGPVPGFVEIDAEPGGNALTLSFYASDADAPFSRRTLRGQVNDAGVFESSTRWDACLNPYLFIILGWDVRRKKTFLSLDLDQNLIVGTSQRVLLIGLFAIPFYSYSEQNTSRLERVDKPDATGADAAKTTDIP